MEWVVAYKASDAGWMGTASHYSGLVSVCMTILPKRASSA